MAEKWPKWLGGKSLRKDATAHFARKMVENGSLTAKKRNEKRRL
jgi:hypothetical protein